MVCSGDVSESHYRLVSQRSAGPDGVAYAGVDARDGRPVLVQRLFLASRIDQRWRALCHRIRLAETIAHPGCVRLLAFDGGARDPFLVTPLYERTLSDALEDGLRRERTLGYTSAIAQCLQEAHRLGVMHGRLCPSRVFVDDADQIRIDLFGPRTGDARPLSDQDRACLIEGDHITPATDVYALGGLCVALLTGKPAQRTHLGDDQPTSVATADQRLDALILEMLAPDPDARPSMAEVVARLSRAESTEVFTDDPEVVKPLETSDVPAQIGRFRIVDLIGEGGMGRVYRAEDIADGRQVALKVLRDHFAEDEQALRRFYREARVLADLDNPHIAAFIEVNEDAGRHYLAMELVEGKSLNEVLDEQTRLAVEKAMSVTREVALALADVHDLGIVHRDIKPANILLTAEHQVKLCDFGIAREVDQRDELLTAAGMAVGTPHYMSPEQCTGSAVDAATDIYALGITLYKMLTGIVPFNAPDARAIVYKHLAEDPPPIRERCPEIDHGGVELLARMLAKHPDDRIRDARVLLDELERIRRGTSQDIAAHPRLPDGAGKSLSYRFEWNLESTPSQLWPYVSHTERLNRAIGLDSIDFTRRNDEGFVETYGKLRLAGMLLDWREHPYEWVAPRRMGILREFASGPFVWLHSSVELIPRGTGTQLIHVVQVEPRGVLGRAAAAMEVGYKARKNLERVYQRIDAFCQQGRSGATGVMPAVTDASGQAVLDPFEDPPQLDDTQLARIEEAEERLLDEGVALDVARKLCSYLRFAPPQEAARIRPRAFARRFLFDHREVLRACLFGAKHGLFVLLWDVICPRCQIPSNIVETLEALREHQHCDACDLSFDADLGSSVEIIFRAHPQVRDSELGVYCIGGPGHTPHVIVQVRLAPGERFEADLRLDPGHYRVAGRQMRTSWGFTVEPDAPLQHWELPLREGLPPLVPRIIGSGTQRIVLCNDADHEIVARIEKTAGREDAVTAAEVACSPLFRQLFPTEVLAPGHLVAISHVTLLLVELTDAWQPGEDEASMYGRINALQQLTQQLCATKGGAVVKLVGDGVMAVFNEPTGAVRAGLALLDQGRHERLRLAAHAGAAMATSINDRLDYFGRIVRELHTLLNAAEPATMMVSEALYADPGVSALLAAHGGRSVVEADGVVGQLLSA